MRRCALVLVLALGCSRKAPTPTADAAPAFASAAAEPGPFAIPVIDVPPVPTLTREEAMRVRAEFELAPHDQKARGTNAIYFRDHFVPAGSPLVFDDADWIGRLRAAFGARENDRYVLRHRPTDIVIAAYLENGVAMFSGGYKVEGPLATGAEVDARIAADPVLAARSPRDRALAHFRGKVPNDVLASPALREADHAWDRQFARVVAPPGSAPVFEKLGAILEAMAPADWSALRHRVDGPVQRVGVRDGKSFSENVPVAEGLAALLAAAENKPGAEPIGIGGPIGPDYDAVRYFINYREQNASIEGQRPRVQNAWFRLAARVRTLSGADAGAQARLANAAKADALKLGIEAARADAALR